ncbi:hypothetical protein Tco_0081920 [Tanacetum coccineum]
MSNINTNLKTQTSNALHNAIMEAGGKDHPPMLAPGNYNPPYKFKWIEKIVPLRAEILVRTANPLALVAQQESVYHPQNHPTHYTNNISTISQPAATRNRGKAIVNSPPPTYDPDPALVTDDDEMSK